MMYVNMLLVLRVALHTKLVGVQKNSFLKTTFLRLMKLLQNYFYLHLVAFFHCSGNTVVNVSLTFIEVLQKLLFKDIMSTVLSREKNKTSLPSSFRPLDNCRMIWDFIDIKISLSPSKWMHALLQTTPWGGTECCDHLLQQTLPRLSK